MGFCIFCIRLLIAVRIATWAFRALFGLITITISGVNIWCKTVAPNGRITSWPVSIALSPIVAFTASWPIITLTRLSIRSIALLISLSISSGSVTRLTRLVAIVPGPIASLPRLILIWPVWPVASYPAISIATLNIESSARYIPAWSIVGASCTTLIAILGVTSGSVTSAVKTSTTTTGLRFFQSIFKFVLNAVFFNQRIDQLFKFLGIGIHRIFLVSFSLLYFYRSKIGIVFFYLFDKG